MCKALGIEKTEKLCKLSHTQAIVQHEVCKVLWNKRVHTDREVMANKPDIIVKSKRESMCTDWCSNTVPAKRKVKLREAEKKLMHEFTYAGTVNVEHEMQVCTCLLAPWSRFLLEKLTGFQLVKKFPEFYGTPRFFTAFTSARQLSLSWTRSMQSVPPLPPPIRRIEYPPFNLIHLDLLSGLFPSGFPTKTMYTLLLSSISAICPAHLIHLDFITQILLDDKWNACEYR